MLDMLNSAALMVMVVRRPPDGPPRCAGGAGAATSQELAGAAGLDERYVREWLGAMTAGRIVELDPETARYTLPSEHAAWLTRAASPDNLAVEAQWITSLSTVEDDIVECFRRAGGCRTSGIRASTRSWPRRARRPFSRCSSRTSSRSFRGWPSASRRGRRSSISVAGAAGRSLMLAERFPESTFRGFDLSADAIAYAREQAAERGLENVSFEQRDLSTFDVDAEPEAFAFVTTFDAVHDQARPLALLKGIRRTLEPDGVYLMQDIQGSSHVHENIDHPGGPLLYMISCMHCMTVSLAQGGDGLGAMWGEQKARELLAEAGFASVDVHLLEHDPFNAYFVVRP